MSSSTVVTTAQVQAGHAWVRAFYEAFDSTKLDVDSWLNEFYDPDATLTHGNYPPLKGYKEISTSIKEDRNQRYSRHIIKHVDVLPDRIYAEVAGILIQKNDPKQKEIIIKGLTVFHKKTDENKTSAIVIYMDPTPLIQRMKAL